MKKKDFVWAAKSNQIKTQVKFLLVRKTTCILPMVFGISCAQSTSNNCHLTLIIPPPPPPPSKNLYK